MIWTEVLKALNSVPSEVWQILIDALIGSPFVVTLVAAIKKFFSVDGEKKMIIITTVFSLISGAVVYLIKDPVFAPWVVPVVGFVTLGVTQPVYFLFLKPLFRRLGAVIANQIAKATKIVEARAALVPEGGLPSPAPSATDFGA